jgi:hypothetical protein
MVNGLDKEFDICNEDESVITQWRYYLITKIVKKEGSKLDDFVIISEPT